MERLTPRRAGLIKVASKTAVAAMASLYVPASSGFPKVIGRPPLVVRSRRDGRHHDLRAHRSLGKLPFCRRHGRHRHAHRSPWVRFDCRLASVPGSFPRNSNRRNHAGDLALGRYGIRRLSPTSNLSRHLYQNKSPANFARVKLNITTTAGRLFQLRSGRLAWQLPCRCGFYLRFPHTLSP